MGAQSSFASRIAVVVLVLFVPLGCGHESTATTDTVTTSTSVEGTATSNTVGTETTATETGFAADLSALLATMTPTPVSTSAPPEPAPLTIATASNTDENLFMVQLLHSYYDDFPSSSDATRDDVVKWLSSTRTNIASARRVIEMRRLDADVDALYQGGIRYINAYEDYLASVGAIERRSDSTAVVDAMGSAWKGYQTTDDVQDAARKFGMSDEDSSDAGLLGGIISGLVEYERREAARNRERAAAIAVQTRVLNEVSESVTSQSRATVARLTRRHGWRTGEAGFDGYGTKPLNEQLKRRGRDPFLKIRFANIRLDKESATDVLNDAYRAVAAVEFVPPGSAYDAIRQDYFAVAAELACTAASTEADAGGYSARPSTAGTALSFARGYLAAYPNDAEGRGHVALARALAFSGRYHEAITAANVALDKASDQWRSNGAFCYRYAAFLSLAGTDLQYVAGWLRSAYKNGFAGAASVRSPDFENFRRSYPAEYKELTTENFGFRIDFGILNDDIIIFNNAPFRVTNLDMTMTIRQGAKTWTPQLQCASIAPGGSCKIVDAVSVTGSRYDDVSATYDCDQCVK